MCLVDDSWVQVGMADRDGACRKDEDLGNYLDVQVFADWIRESLCKNLIV